MRKVRDALLLALMVQVGTTGIGCGDSGNSKPEMVVPEAPPAVQGKSSMDAYLQANPKAAKGAAPDVRPKQ